MSPSCPDCGAPLPPDGMCTQCLIRLGLDSRSTEVPQASAVPQGDPQTIGAYRVVRKLGEGGMGVVYLAEQEQPIRRSVAIKIIKLGMNTREVVARFEAERQTLAEMEHPGIARVFEAGSTADGRPYFVMEHVDGVSITEYCDRHRLTTRQRVALFATVCDAVHHAHLRGVIHRDIKPSNVLVAEIDGQGQPKVIDFGVAKATARSLVERSVFTELGQIVGTLEYMSPEQAELTGLDVDLRSDVYSLGVLFFELLVGSPPFESKQLRQAGLEAMLRAIREEDSPRPSTRISTLGGRATEAARNRRTDPPSLARHLRGDLDWVVMRALEKERDRRYASASELAAEARRYINHEPVQAGPPGSIYRMRKFVRRHRVGVTATSVVLLIVVSLVIFYTSRLRAQRERALVGSGLAHRQPGLRRLSIVPAVSRHCCPPAAAATKAVTARLASVLVTVFGILRLLSGPLYTLEAGGRAGLCIGCHRPRWWCRSRILEESFYHGFSVTCTPERRPRNSAQIHPGEVFVAKSRDPRPGR